MWSLSTCVDEAAAETAREDAAEKVVVVEDRRTCICVCWRALRGGASGAPAAGDRGAQRAAAACDIEMRRDRRRAWAGEEREKGNRRRCNRATKRKQIGLDLFSYLAAGAQRRTRGSHGVLVECLHDAVRSKTREAEVLLRLGRNEKDRTRVVRRRGFRWPCFSTSTLLNLSNPTPLL